MGFTFSGHLGLLGQVAIFPGKCIHQIDRGETQDSLESFSLRHLPLVWEADNCNASIGVLVERWHGLRKSILP